MLHFIDITAYKHCDFDELEMAFKAHGGNLIKEVRFVAL